MSGDHNMYQKRHVSYACPQCFWTLENKNDFNPDWDTVKAFDDRYNEDTELLRRALDALNEVTGWQSLAPQRVMDEVEDAIAALKGRLK
jgi:hypothetical protein